MQYILYIYTHVYKYICTYTHIQYIYIVDEELSSLNVFLIECISWLSLQKRPGSSVNMGISSLLGTQDLGLQISLAIGGNLSSLESGCFNGCGVKTEDDHGAS